MICTDQTIVKHQKSLNNNNNHDDIYSAASHLLNKRTQKQMASG